MTTTSPLLLPIRVMACALDPASVPDTYDAGDRSAPYKWAWSPPDYSGFATSASTPLGAVWPNLFHAGPGGAAAALPPPLAGGAPGVCVSWSLPPGWSRPLDPKDPRSLPRIPDRWLVVRFARRADAPLDAPPRVRTWVVDAGVLVNESSTDAHDLRSARVLVEGEVAAGPRRVGAVRTVEAACEAPTRERRVNLHAQGSEAAPDFTFSAFVPANLNNLSFIDPLDDLLNAAKDGASELFASRLTYLVIGWYREPHIDDPLRRCAGSANEKDALRSLGLDPVQRFIEQSGDGASEAAARAALGLPATGSVAPGDTSIFHGIVACVDYFDRGGYFGPVFGAPNARSANNAEGFADPTTPSVGFGETAEEALARLASRVRPDEDESKQLATQSARLFDALLTDSWRYWDAPGGTEAEPRARRASTFRTSPGGAEWAVVAAERKADAKKPDARAGAPSLSAEQRRALFALHEAQRRLDAAEGLTASSAETLYAAWWMHQADPSPADSPRRAALRDFVRRYQLRVEELVAAESAQRKQVTDAAATLRTQIETATGGRLSLERLAGPRFFVPKEPAVALRSVGPRAPGGAFETPWRKASTGCARREGAADPEVAWVDSIARTRDDAAFQGALRALAREGAAVERLVGGVTAHHAEASTRRHYDVWRRRALGVSRDTNGAAIDPPPSQDKTLPRPEAFAGGLVDGTGRKVPLRELASVWTHQPWTPLFLDWEVEWSADGDGVVRSTTLRGRTVLAHRPQRVIRSRYEALAPRVDLGPRLRTALADCAHEIRAVLDADIVAQSLSGLHQQLTLRDDVLPRVLPAKGDPTFPGIDALVERTTNAPVTAAGTEFTAVRSGSLVVRRLWVVDRFGQSYALHAPPLSVPASALAAPGTWRVRVAPRSVEPLRLVMRPHLLSGSSHVVRGWLLASALDASLTAYDSDGAPLGVIASAEGRVRWSPAQTASPASPSGISDPALRAFVERLVVTEGEAPSAKAARFTALLRALDDALARTHPGGDDNTAPAAQLGRPLALVRARVGVERRGGPIADPNWLRSEAWLRKSAAEFEDASAAALRAQGAPPVTLTVGSRFLVDDGVVGYFRVGAERDDDSAELVQTVKTLGPSAPKLSVPLPRADATSTVMLDLLLDPRGRVHLDGDMVPASTFSLAPEWYETTLRRLPAVVRVSSLLLGADALAAEGAERPRTQLPLPAAARSNGAADATPAEASLATGDLELAVDAEAPTGVVAQGEALVVDGVLRVGGVRAPSNERPADDRDPRPMSAAVARGAAERRVAATGESIDLQVMARGAQIRFRAATEWLEYNGRVELFLTVTLSSEGAPTAPAASTLALTLPTDWKPGDVFVGSSPGSVGLADNTQRPWKVDASVITDWEVSLTRLEPARPATKDAAPGTATKDATPGTATKDATPSAPGVWCLAACVLLRQSKKPTAVPLTFSVDGGAAVSIDVVPGPQKLAPYSVKLTSDTADTSALKYGSSFVLSWDVSRVLGAELWGPLSDDGSNHLTILPRPGGAVGEDSAKGSKQVVVMGPMNFTLRAKVKVGDRVEEVVRSVTAGVLTDPRGGRLDVWPRQVLPRGPIAARWSAYKVTEFKFHSITGDVLDDETDGPAIGTDLYEYRPSDAGWATTVQGVPFTIDYGPRAGQDWTVEAECEPEGDARALQCRVSAIGTRKLASSLVDSDSSNAQWSYLAVGALPAATERSAGGAAPPSLPNVDAKEVVAMAVGRFAANAGDGPERWREWIAVATRRGLDVHINKLFDQRSYRVNPALHPKVEWLRAALEGEVLGVGAAEIAFATKSTDPKEPTVHELRGECVVTVRKTATVGVLRVSEFRFPLDPAQPPVDLTFEDKGLAQVERVRVVALWPRVYVLGVGVAFSYDRTDPDPKNWKAVPEPKLTRIASPEWDVVGVPRPRAPGAAGSPMGGYLFALARTTGRLCRYELKRSEVIRSEFVEMASANGMVAPLHELQTAQGNYNYRSALSEGRILLGRDEQNRLDWRNPINEESVLLMIGGALVARSEVHDPLVQPVYSRSELGRERRGIQDRAYNPRLDLWVRCGHPFFHARTGKGALFDSTARSLYCRTAEGEISYISPIEPSHLGFLAVDLAPRTDGFKATTGVAFDNLVAGQSLWEGEFLESKNKRYRLTLTTKGLRLHEAAASGAERWTLKTDGTAADHATLAFHGDLELFSDRDVRLSRATENDATVGSLVRQREAAERERAYSNVRLVLADDGVLRCLAKRADNGRESVLWAAPPLTLGATIAAETTIGPGCYMESPNRRFRLEMQADEGYLRLYEVGGGGRWELRGNAPHSARFTRAGELILVNQAGVPDFWGGGATTTPLFDEYRRSPSPDRFSDARLTLTDQGNLVCFARVPNRVDARSPGMTPSVERELWSVSRLDIGSRLNAGATLDPWQYLEIANRVRLQFRGSDGVLALYRLTPDAMSTLWSSAPVSGARAAEVSATGEVVVRDAAGAVAWSSTKDGGLPVAPSARRDRTQLELDERCLRLADGDVTLWAVHHGGILQAGEWLTVDRPLVSPDGLFQLVLHADGNLVFYDRVTSTPLWATNRYCKPGRALLQTDGDLVVFNDQGGRAYSLKDFGCKVEGNDPGIRLGIGNGQFFIGGNGPLRYSSRQVRIRNGNRYLTVRDNERAHDTWIAFLPDGAGPTTWWEPSGNANQLTFRLMDANLYLNFTNSHGRVKLWSDGNSVRWSAEPQGGRCYALRAHHDGGRYMFFAGDELYATTAGQGRDGWASWDFDGPLLPAGFALLLR